MAAREGNSSLDFTHPGPIESLKVIPSIRVSVSFAGREDVMADKKKAAEGGAVSDTKAADKAAGKKAVAPEAAVESAPRMKSTKIPRLSKKNKSRLPRREKKARQKADNAKQSGG
jgi:hypothetical protein